MDAYASLEDLQSRWRSLSADEQQRAMALLSDAAVKITLACRQGGVIIDAADDLQGEALKAINCEMVKRAMMSPIDMPPMSSFAQTAGSYSESQTYVNPTGDLYMTMSERKMLGIGVQRMGSIPPLIGGA
ncbi:Gp19/Gp15/Gp42 family protein [Eubacterium sp.]|uniref:Gp19/Gp15/Gp42 family protein n=1 Tax=Eubacterium sp. TaxID=142586 RepID=UPI002FC9DCAD